MLCGILVVVALLGLLGTAPSASAEKCTVEIITHAHKVVTKVTVDSGESGCNEKFHTEDGSLKVCEAIQKASVEERNLPGAKSLDNWCAIGYVVNAFLVSVAETGAEGVRGDTVRFMFNNDMTYDFETEELHILGVLVDFSGARPVAEAPTMELGASSLIVHSGSVFLMDRQLCAFEANAEILLDDSLRDLIELGEAEPIRSVVDRTEPEQMTLLVRCTTENGEKFVKLPDVLWSKIVNLFSHCQVKLWSYGLPLLQSLCYNVVGVTEAGQLDLQSDIAYKSGLERIWHVGSWVDYFSPSAMEGKAHHHQRKGHRHKRRAARRRGRRGRHAHRGRRGR